MDWSTYEPCPECGVQSDNFRQVIQQMEDITLDENGEMENVEIVSDSFEIVAVACTECDTILLGDESYF